MELSDFDYDLPAELIAQEPAKQRDQSRLLHVGRGEASLSHHRFSDLLGLLPKDCVLVCNNTRVIPARLRGKKTTGGKVELLLVRRTAAEGEVWQVLCKGGQKQKVGGRINFADKFWGKWVEVPRAGQGSIRFFPGKGFSATCRTTRRSPAAAVYQALAGPARDRPGALPNGVCPASWCGRRSDCRAAFYAGVAR